MFQALLSKTPLLYFTQSLWRDEAFSILVAEKPIANFIGKLSFEPPVYYVLLHFWIKLFGTSEIATRSLSLLGFAIATFIVVLWAEKLFEKHWLSWFLPIFFFFNPMLLYYAFEIRTYGWFICFATLSIFAYQQKHWKLYAAGLLLGFYTHSYFIFLPIALLMHYFIIHRGFIDHTIRSLIKDTFIRANAIFAIGIFPWMLIILQQMSRLKNSWYFPVDVNLIKSVLGNMFIGYEGTPWYLWNFTALLSLVFVVATAIALIPKKTRQKNMIFVCMIYIPLSIVIGISFIKPLFVNRYLIPVTIAEIILFTLAIEAIHSKWIQKIAAITALAFCLGVNIWFPSQKPKINIRQTFQEISAIKKPQDIIFAETPLVLFESMYYSKNRNQVFLYNPNHNPFPWYVGDAVFSPTMMTDRIPSYPQKAFLIHENGKFSVISNSDFPENNKLLPTNK